MPAHIYTSPPIHLASPFRRADIVIEGFNQAGPSFEARVFINNTNADETTALARDAGYVGSVHIYGGGGDPTGVEQLPMTRSMQATEAVRRALQHETALAITVVAVPYSADVSPQQAGLTLELNRVSITTDAAR